jgi:hypothetical protein
MNRKELLIWSAGVIEGCGILAVSIQQGPTRMYHAIDLLVPLNDSRQIRRLTIAANNGSVSKMPKGFHLGGHAAVRGFLEDLWPYLSPAKKKEFNAELKRYKYYRAQDKQRGLTRE